MSTKYSYLVTDTANDLVDVGALTEEIQDSSITIALDYISVVGNALDIYFKVDLSEGEQTTLDDIVAAHTGEPLPDVQTVQPEVASLQEPHKNVQRIVIQPGRTDHFMCDRDIKICTSMYAAEDAFEDLKVDLATMKQVPWGEFSLVGCYKEDGAGGYEECDDQIDADTNAVLSVFDYLAIKQSDSSALNYDFKGGCLWSDKDLQGDKWKHRLYAVMAPNIPPSMGGSARFFDGYLYPYEGRWQEAVNSLAIEVDPSQTVEAARTRFFLYYPAGAKNSHVLRIITFRLAESF